MISEIWNGEILRYGSSFPLWKTLPSNNPVAHNGICKHFCWVVCGCFMHIKMLHVFDHNFDFTLVLFVVFYCIVDRTLGVRPSESPAVSYRTEFESQCTDRHPQGHRSSSPKSGGFTNQQVIYTINQSMYLMLHCCTMQVCRKLVGKKRIRSCILMFNLYVNVYMISIYM